MCIVLWVVYIEEAKEKTKEGNHSDSINHSFLLSCEWWAHWRERWEKDFWKRFLMGWMRRWDGLSSRLNLVAKNKKRGPPNFLSVSIISINFFSHIPIGKKMNFSTPITTIEPYVHCDCLLSESSVQWIHSKEINIASCF